MSRYSGRSLSSSSRDSSGRHPLQPDSSHTDSVGYLPSSEINSQGSRCLPRCFSSAFVTAHTTPNVGLDLPLSRRLTAAGDTLESFDSRSWPLKEYQLI